VIFHDDKTKNKVRQGIQEEIGRTFSVERQCQTETGHAFNI